MQFKPVFDEIHVVDFSEYDVKAFDAFQNEIKQDVGKSIREMQT